MAKISIGERFDRLKQRVLSFYEYCTVYVWRDRRNNWRVNTIKTLNLTISSIFDTDMQSTACAMTYRTVLALVPVLAMVFAICRGFGFESLLTQQLYKFFPSQHEALAQAMRFVDSYLSQASEGVFVGVGIVFLLWTVISLLSSVEASFNKIWNVRQGRTFWRQTTDYMGIMIVLPVLMICSSGITVMLDTALKRFLPFDFMTPALTALFEVLSFLLIVFFFAGSYMLIPNTKVRFKNAFFSGLLTATAYTVLQWLFVTGQMYVSKYNAIYGSFSFLPLLLIWLQLVWLFTYIGAEICYASQNFSRFDYHNLTGHISTSYSLRVTVAVCTVIIQRFEAGEEALTAGGFSRLYCLPLGVVERCYDILMQAGLMVSVDGGNGKPSGVITPTRGMASMTLGQLVGILISYGASDYIDGFDNCFGEVTDRMKQLTEAMVNEGDNMLISSIKIKD